jgi:transposase
LYNIGVKTLFELEKRSENDEIDLFYGDETGISLKGYSPYGWQFKDEKVAIPVTRSRQINIFGLVSRQNKFHFRATTNTIDTDFIVDFFDEFVINLTKSTVVVLDNAIIHKSKKFKERVEYWQSRGLFFVYLPPYSPHLNIIERLWLELKQRWLRPEDYQSFEKLQYALQLLLMTIGEKLKLKFKAFNYSNK